MATIREGRWRDELQALHAHDLEETRKDLMVIQPLDALEEAIAVATERRVAFESLIATQDADLECRHGTCPGDSRPQTQDCRCHPTVPVPDEWEPRAPVAVVVAPRTTNGVQTLTCATCGSEWTRPVRRGRWPQVCPGCVDA